VSDVQESIKRLMSGLKSTLSENVLESDVITLFRSDGSPKRKTRNDHECLSKELSEGIDREHTAEKRV